MNKKKISILVVLTLLGAGAFMCGSAYSKETQAVPENSSLTTEVQQAEQPDAEQSDDENKDSDEIKGSKQALEKAQEFMDKKDYNSAIEYLSAFITAKPKKYEGYKLRGDSYYAMRLYSLAEKDYKKAIELKTDDDKFITNTKVISAVVLGADKNEQLQNPELGNLYARLMYAQKAMNSLAYEASYENAVKYNSHIYLPKPNKLEITAINCPQKYGKVLNPQGDDKYLYGAVEDIQHGNFVDAVFNSNHLRSSYPNYYLGYYLNGVALIGLDNEKEAIEAFNQAIALNPNDFESMASLGQIYYYDAEKTFSQRDAQKSIDYFNLALKYNPNCYSYHFYIGLNQLLMGQFSDSINSFTNAIKLNPNDYNSLSYRLIAQYIKSDYKSVIDGATALLYKRVSNYNSILYLRALAYYKTGDYDLALDDLSAIQNNVNDIFDEDVKVKSEKDDVLESYTYYLKAKIMEAQGNGAKSDLQKAFHNPIIQKLDSVEKNITPFTNMLNSHNLSQEEYQKYNNYYMGELPSMLKSNLDITEKDIENQYDYIRTTFDDIGVSFTYVNPDYKLALIPNYVLKRYPLTQLNQNHTCAIPKEHEQEKTEEIAQAPQNAPADEKVENAQKAEETLKNENVVKAESVEEAQKEQQVENVEKAEKVEDAQQIEKVTTAESIEKPLKKETDVRQTLVKEDEPSVAQAIASNAMFAGSGAKEAVKTEPPAMSEAVQKIEQTSLSEGGVDVADNVEKTAVSTEQTALKIKSEEVDKNIGKTVVKAQEVKQQQIEKPVAEKTSPVVNEKHAKVNLNDYDFVHKQMPVIDENTEVIELSTPKTDYSIPNQLSGSFAGFTTPKITDNFSSLNENKSVKTAQEDLTEEERIVLPENGTEVKEESVEVPVVSVPEFSKDIEKTAQSVENSAEQIANTVDKSAEGLDIEGFLDSKDAQQAADNLETAVEEMKSDFEPAQPTRKERAAARKAQKEAKKAEKAKLKAEKKAQKEAQKQAKNQAKETPVNEVKELPTLRPAAEIPTEDNVSPDAVTEQVENIEPEHQEKPVKIKKHKKSDVEKEKAQPQPDELTPETPVSDEINADSDTAVEQKDETVEDEKESKKAKKSKKQEKEDKINSFLESSFGTPEPEEAVETPTETVSEQVKENTPNADEQVKEEKPVRHSRKKSKKEKSESSTEFEPEAQPEVQPEVQSEVQPEQIQEVSSDVSEIQQEEKPEKKVKNKKEKVKKDKNKDKNKSEVEAKPEDTNSETTGDENSQEVIKPISIKQTTKQSPEPVEIINRNGVEKKVIKKIDR